MRRGDGEVRALLAPWRKTAESIRFIDSSFGEDDVRENYILDDRWVLRVNSAPVMNDARLADLNRLVRRCRDFGLAAPAFIPWGPDGKYTVQAPDGSTVYLSEYLNMPTPEHRLPAVWYEKLVAMVAAFAARYRDVDLSATFSMYSLFDLSPYDQPIGADEKQQNCDLLAAALRDAGEGELAAEIAALNAALRQRLRGLYPRLPRCVFQGDENRTNLCLDDAGEIRGIFDFNMAGTDVCVNYLANQVMFLYDNADVNLAARPAGAIFDGIRAAEDKCLCIVRRHYALTPEEERAYPLCRAIVRLFHWNHFCVFRDGLKDPAARDNTVSLIRMEAEDARRAL